MRTSTADLLLATLQLRDGISDATAHDGWAAVDTEGLLGLVVHEGAELWLYRRLQQLNATPPAEFHTALRAAVHRSNFSNMRIDAQTVAVTGVLASLDIPVALVKGQARRAAASQYPFAASRPVSDVDLLVPEEHAERAWRALTDRGFRKVVEGPVDWHVDHHLPTLIDDSNVAVELHTTMSMTVAPAEAWQRATSCADTVTWNDVLVSVPSATELVWQALSHGVADGVIGFNLRTLLSVSAILAVHPPIEWVTIQERVANAEVRDNETGRPASAARVHRFLAVSGALAGTALPEGLAPSNPVDLRALLRWRAWLLQSSMSYAVKERLMEEATRVEALIPLTPPVRGRGRLRAARRLASSVIARLCYLVWRSLN